MWVSKSDDNNDDIQLANFIICLAIWYPGAALPPKIKTLGTKDFLSFGVLFFIYLYLYKIYKQNINCLLYSWIRFT